MHADEAATVFERHRPYLLGVAYRLTGSWADAEDAVADAWPRWAGHAAEVVEPRGWLTRVVGRIALDQLRSARVRRETYIGPWLPEPVVSAVGGSRAAERAGADPADAVVWDESIRFAFLVVLDQLTPEQRLAVVLHDVAALDFGEVGEVIGCSAATARQHASRGRRRLDSARVPPRPPDPEMWAVLGQLAAALEAGDADSLAALLAPDVVLTGDGGGQVAAVRRQLLGRYEVTRLLAGLAMRYGPKTRFEPAVVNGELGFVARVDSDRPQDAKVAVYSLTLSDGLIAGLYGVLAPDKTVRVPEPMSAPPGPGTPPHTPLPS